MREPPRCAPSRRGPPRCWPPFRKASKRPISRLIRFRSLRRSISSFEIRLARRSYSSTSPLRTERTDVPIEEIVDVIAIGRGVGLWGDMVITLKNQEKIELRSLPDFKKLEEHIKSRMGEADPEYAKI